MDASGTKKSTAALGVIVIIGVLLAIALVVKKQTDEMSGHSTTTTSTTTAEVTTSTSAVDVSTELTEKEEVTETTTAEVTTADKKELRKQKPHELFKKTSGLNERKKIPPRKIFAQYYLSATYRYNETFLPNIHFQWDIEHAVKARLDGFILNLGGQPWELDRLDQMYAAASSFDNFKLFVNLDLTYQVNTEPNYMISLLKRNLNSEAQFRIDEKPVFGTYMGHDLTFGEQNRVTGWMKHFIQPLKLQNISVYFIPYWPLSSDNFFVENFFVDAYQSFRAWPTGDKAIDYEDDLKFIEAAHKANKKVMSSVSPCYFSHSAEKNLVYRSEDTWHVRWMQLVENECDFAQVVSWNGFHESHAVGPINEHSSAAKYQWYNGMSNLAFTKMLPFYAKWFQSRRQPVVTENVIYYYHRPYSKWVSQASNDSLPKPGNWIRATDAFVVHSFIKDHGEYHVQILVDNKPDKYAHFTLKGGTIGHLLVPFPSSPGVSVLLVRSGNAELNRTLHPTKILKPNCVKLWNFNFDSRFITF